jgi:hypothetical protein
MLIWTVFLVLAHGSRAQILKALYCCTLYTEIVPKF